MEEIQNRLRSKESQKAMALLALAMSQHEALKYMKKEITEKVIKSNGSNKKF